ncbi:uncharacterized protein P174DRAFT_418298 [Aspergillus novofumigatus IBT 16806]|uniref:ER transporter 6TM N-terminal domain-containing protein n=1 Tax=Aspergillus novofumigatus (strain IBT 16806) TaxID=1392255 RepID=A0A2I1CI68_ASPN1|nr:uncharacterized protein P174DRAFT_418298 [Aspergillus novofumigatus IBT 16806]PKX97326.1 hypothetical protein P174DRAFT_418298 [Aspergillus novofumigatus IBT 16806]
MASRVSSRQSTSSSQYSQNDEPDNKKQQQKWNLFRMIKNGWSRLDLDRRTVILMMKGALPPAIAIAMYQADSIAARFPTTGYLIAIISVLGFAIMPRAKFIQMMLLDVLAVCVATAFALLMMFCSVKARENTQSAADAASISSSDPTANEYNSSASAVSGVLLFFQIYLVHSFRAHYQQFQFPVIIYAIIANITSSYAPRLPTMAAGIALVRTLLEACLIGLGICTGVSLFLFPVTSRHIVFKEMASYIGGLRVGLKAHTKYFESLERDDMFGRAETYDETVEKFSKKGKVYSPEAEAIRTAIQKITDLHGKLHADLTFAKREFAIGKLGPDDLQAIFRHLRQVMIPVVGLSFIVDIFQRLSEYNKWNDPIDPLATDIGTTIRSRVVHEWNEIMKAVHDPFASIIETIDSGLEHISLSLQLTKSPKASLGKKDAPTEGVADLEASAEKPRPREKQGEGHHLTPDFFERPSSDLPDLDEFLLDKSGVGRDRSRRQLYLFLYMEQLLYSTGHTVLDFIHFADEKVKSGKLSRSRLIIPGAKRLLKWLRSILQAEDTHEDDHLGDIHTQNHILQLGEAYRHRKDPEHLPPETTIQKIGDKIRVIPWLLRSSESAYGFRVACATMTIYVVGLLHQSQTFFIHQRLVWAMIMVNISMSPTAGQSIFGFVLRLIGTVIAMALSFLAWYIPDEKTPGVIVFFWLFVACGFYVPIKLFRFRIVGIIIIITTSMIIGYELQVRKVGQQVASSNGQAYYPIYLLAPYRLAIVAAGIAVAFFWTFFPFPISEHGVLRQSLGASLYLLANYYSIIHESVSARLRDDEGDLALKTSAGRRLQKARGKVFSKQMLMLNGLRTSSEFLKWEVPIGGRFPKKRYQAIISSIENIVNYLSLLGYASDTLLQIGDDPHASNSDWLHDFKRLVSSARVTTHEVTSVLCLLSASITNRQPLPPYLKTPRPYSFTRRLEALDKDILSIKHVAEPGFATFSVLQISTRCIVGDVERLMRNVKALVGELDFSFHAVSTAHSTKSSLDQSRLSRPPSREKFE